MSRCMYQLYFDRTNLEYLPVFGNHRIISNSSIGRTKNNLGSGFSRKVHMSAHKISMKMRFKNVLNGYAVLFCTIDIRGYFPQGVDNSRLISGNNIISALRQTAGINLFDLHNATCFLNYKEPLFLF